MKLFKKVAAAVLAGVMALSMVACGTTPVTPDAPVDPVDPTKSPEEQFFAYLNYSLNTVKAAETKNNKIVVPTVENDLKDVALEILDAIAEGEAVYDTTGKVKGFKVDLPPVSMGSVTVYTKGEIDAPKMIKGVTITADKNDLKYDKAEVKALALLAPTVTTGNDAWFKTKTETVVTNPGVGETKVTTTTYTAKVQIGAASKTINGETCFVIVTKAV